MSFAMISGVGSFMWVTLDMWRSHQTDQWGQFLVIGRKILKGLAECTAQHAHLGLKYRDIIAQSAKSAMHSAKHFDRFSRWQAVNFHIGENAICWVSSSEVDEVVPVASKMSHRQKELTVTHQHMKPEIVG